MENGLLVHQHLHLSSLNLSQSEAEGGRGFTDCGRARLPACTSYKESVSTAGAGYLRPALSKKNILGLKQKGHKCKHAKGLLVLYKGKVVFIPLGVSALFLWKPGCVPLAVYASLLPLMLIELSMYPRNKKRKDVLRLASRLGSVI